MKILAMEKEIPNIEVGQFTDNLKEEARRVWQLYQDGVIRELYFRQDKSDAVLILECSNIDEASRVINDLPLVKAGLIIFDLIPLIAYPGFSRLFINDQ